MTEKFEIPETPALLKARATDASREARHIASTLNALERAEFLRDLVFAVYNAVKSDPLMYGSAQQGVEWERESIGKVYSAADAHYGDVLRAEVSTRDTDADLAAAHRELAAAVESARVVNMSPCGMDPQNAESVRARARLIRTYVPSAPRS